MDVCFALPAPSWMCYKPYMRKWMRERLQRRQKTTSTEASEPKAAPLQPAYFEGDPQSHSSEDSSHENSPVSQHADESAEGSAEPAHADSVGANQPVGDSRGNARPKPNRRRRGGRGGRGRTPRRSTGPEAVPAASPDIAPPSEPQEMQAPASRSQTPKGTVVLAVGLPGSGKSSWFKRHNITPLSSDMLRALLFDDATEQRFQDLVFSNLRSMLKARLIARRPMTYVDATNLTPQDRHSWIKLCKDFGYEVQAVFFDVPLEVCLERNSKRERVVEEAVMRRFAAKLKPPTFEEGFAKITVVRVKQKQSA